MTKLRIAEELTLPLDAVTQTMSAIGRKGAGKTYLATLIAEQMLDAEAQIVVIDPVGNWWGLRVAADGRSKGKDIFVIGGEHGDVPLVSEAGAKIARLLVEKRISAVLDISGFRQGERKRFAADFGEEFFHLKKTQRSPVHVFVEEAQLFAPQRSAPDEARMLGAFENIIRLGRNYGVGATLITQRPQSVNKEVLSQVECLCVLQVNGTHERKALEDWVQEAGADRKLVGELPGLSRGEGFVWSPSWLRIYQRVHFSKKTTFDASATPEVGKAAKAATLSSIDVDALRADLQEVVAQAEKDDPKVLRKEIAELKRELAKKPAAAVEPVAAKPVIQEKLVEMPVITNAPALQKSAVEVLEMMQVLKGDIRAFMDRTMLIEQDQRRILEQFSQRHSQKPAKNIPKNIPASNGLPRTERAALSRSVAKPSNGHRPDGVSAAHIKILSRLAELIECTGNDRIAKEQLAAWSEYSPTGGGYNNYLGALRSMGLIDYPTPGYVTLTDEGREVAKPDNVPTTNSEMLERAMRILGGSEARILEQAWTAYPDSIDRARLADATGFNPTGGGFNNYLGHMRTLGFIEYPQKGFVRAADWLFLEQA